MKKASVFSDKLFNPVLIEEAIPLSKSLLKKNFLAGLNVFKGQVTYKAVADTFGHKYISPKEALTN